MKSKFWEDRVIGAVGLVGSIVFIAITTYEMAFEDGKAAANKTMWEKGPGGADCVVYVDGAKRCWPVRDRYIEPMSKIECIRMCAGRERMEKVK
jgi:hypothetical protein